MVTVYVMDSLTYKFRYVGMTREFETRIARHNRGGSKSTKAYAPYKIVYTKSFKDYESARIHEKFLKSGKGRAFLKDYLSGSLPD